MTPPLQQQNSLPYRLFVSSQLAGQSRLRIDNCRKAMNGAMNIIADSMSNQLSWWWLRQSAESVCKQMLSWLQTANNVPAASSSAYSVPSAGLSGMPSPATQGTSSIAWNTACFAARWPFREAAARQQEQQGQDHNTHTPSRQCVGERGHYCTRLNGGLAAVSCNRRRQLPHEEL